LQINVKVVSHLVFWANILNIFYKFKSGFLDLDSELVPMWIRTWGEKSDLDPDKRYPDPKHCCGVY